jgi:hypothetical protein
VKDIGEVSRQGHADFRVGKRSCKAEVARTSGKMNALILQRTNRQQMSSLFFSAGQADAAYLSPDCIVRNGC